MNSNMKQLIAILLTGFGIIRVMLIMENAGMGSIAAVGEENGNSFQVIQTEINKIKPVISNGTSRVTSSTKQKPSEGPTVAVKLPHMPHSSSTKQKTSEGPTTTKDATDF